MHGLHERDQGYVDDSDFDKSAEDFLVAEASQMISGGDIAVVMAGNDYPHYLVKLICDPFTTESETKDDYDHTYPEHRIVIDNYLRMEQFSTQKTRGKQLYLVSVL